MTTKNKDGKIAGTKTCSGTGKTKPVEEKIKKTSLTVSDSAETSKVKLDREKRNKRAESLAAEDDEMSTENSISADSDNGDGSEQADSEHEWAETISVATMKTMLNDFKKSFMQEFATNMMQELLKEIKDTMTAQLHMELEKMKAETAKTLNQMRKEMEQIKTCDQEATTQAMEKLDTMRAEIDDVKKDMNTIQTQCAPAGQSAEDVMLLRVQFQEYAEEQEKRQRALNLRIVGLVEKENENTKAAVEEFFAENLNVQDAGIVEAFCIGKRDTGTRHIIVRFHNREARLAILKNRNKLNGKFVWVNEDLTKDQMLAKKQELKE